MKKKRKLFFLIGSICLFVLIGSAYIFVQLFNRYPAIDDAEYWVGLHLCQRKLTAKKTTELQRTPHEPPTVTVAILAYNVANKLSPKPRHSLTKKTIYIKHWEYICAGDNVLVECLVIYDRVFEISIVIDNKTEYYDAYQFIDMVKESKVLQKGRDEL